MYEQCGFEADGGLSTVHMLANMEARLEELCLGVADLSPEAVAACQRQREKERRQVHTHFLPRLWGLSLSSDVNSSAWRLGCAR